MSENWPYEEEAKAFDEADFDLSAMRRADTRVAREPKSSLAVRFDVADLDRLRQRAEAEGVGITQLVRSWVLERLDEPADASPVPDLLVALEAALVAARAIKRSKPAA